MKTTIYLAAAIIGLAVPAAAIAGANKTWVSGTGKDTGTCPISAPCASFQYAVDQTAAGGEVDVKDAGGYGVVTITKAITIVADGVLASISVPSGGTGIAVNAGVNDVVTLKGLTIDGHGIGQYGVKATSFVHLTIEDTVVQRLTVAGIYADGTNGTVRRYLTITRVTARENAIGIDENNNEGSNQATYIDSIFSHNATGLHNMFLNSNMDNCKFDSNTIKGLDNFSNLVITNSKFYLDASETLPFVDSTGDNVLRDYAGSKFGNPIVSKQ